MKKAILLTACGILLHNAIMLHAEISFGPVFRSNGMIQSQVAAPVFGYAEPGETVQLRVRDMTAKKNLQTKEAVADNNGKWIVYLDPMPPGLTLRLFATSGKNIAQLQMVKTGDVWFYAGPYTFRYPRTFESKLNETQWREQSKDLWPYLRIFTVNATAQEPLSTIPDGKGGWNSPDYLHRFYSFNPGLATEFGAIQVRDQKIPVGIISASTLYPHPVEEYIPASDYLNNPVLSKTQDAAKLRYTVPGNEEYRKFNEKKIAAVENWLTHAERSYAAEGFVPPPELPALGKEFETKVGIRYNASIAPILPFAIKGAIFNPPNPNNDPTYGAKIQQAIKSFRKMFRNDKLPILIFAPIPKASHNSKNAKLQFDALQTLAQKDSNVIIVTRYDIPRSANTIDALLVDRVVDAKRAYLLARRSVFGDKAACDNEPKPVSFSSQNGILSIRFSAPLETTDGQPPHGFAIAGDNKRYNPAEAVIEGDTIKLSSKKVKNPAYATYGYDNLALKNGINLCGKSKMPIAVFCTELINQKERPNRAEPKTTTSQRPKSDQ